MSGPMRAAERPAGSSKLLRNGLTALLGLLPVLLATGGGPARGAARRLPPILFQQQLTCPDSHMNCSVAPYNARFYEIAKVGRPPKPLTSGTYDDALAAWSPDRKLIGFERTTSTGPAPSDFAYAVWVMNADGSHKRKVAELSNLYSSPSWSWSPGGKRIALDSPSPDGNAIDLSTVALDGTGEVRLTTHTDGVLAGASIWSPDGSQIAVETEDDNRNTISIDVVGARGDTATTLCTWCRSPRWSPDGTKIAFEAVSPATDEANGTYVANADGSGLVKLGGGKAGQPTWSPSGRKIAFESPTAAFTVDPDGTGRRRVARGREIAELAWSPRGTMLAFTSDAPSRPTAQIHVVGTNGRGAKRLTPGDSFSNYMLSWSPDGSRILFIRAGARGAQVAVVRPDGTGLRQLTKARSRYDVSLPSWLTSAAGSSRASKSSRSR